MEVKEAADSLYFLRREIEKKKKSINVRQSGSSKLREEGEAPGLVLSLLIAAQQEDRIGPIRIRRPQPPVSQSNRNSPKARPLTGT